MLDYSPVSIIHPLLFAGSFITTFILVKLLLGFPAALRQHKVQTSVRYAGVILASSIILFSLIIVSDTSLRIGLLLSAVLIIIIGALDEQFSLSPQVQFIGQSAVAVIATLAGWVILYVSNPWAAGLFNLDWLSIGPLIIPGTILTIIWLVFLMNAINWLDGADGLASGVVAVTFITLAAVSLLPSVQDRQTLSLALIGAGATIAFLIWNWAPARVYLGTSGSWFLGLFLGLVAINGGGKIATTLLVLAIPSFDVLIVVIQRLRSGRMPWHGDQTLHLHHRLSAIGLSPSSISLLAITVTATLGLAALLLQTRHKLWLLLAISLMMIMLTMALIKQQKNRKTL